MSYFIEGGVKTFLDGRQVCIRAKADGRREYKRRTMQARDRQGELCCLCGLWMSEDETTFEHENNRTAGHIDERLTLPDGTLQNGASHGRCNLKRGSTRSPFLFHSIEELA